MFKLVGFVMLVLGLFSVGVGDGLEFDGCALLLETGYCALPVGLWAGLYCCCLVVDLVF